MNYEYQAYLFKRYADLFPSQRETPSDPMYYGFECSNGWVDLIDTLLGKIASLNPPDDFIIVQVKEKMGTLRVYTENAPKNIQDLCTYYERLSAEVCEYCGEDGKLVQVDHLIKTLCPDCEEIQKLPL